jgi:hypothetical protein
MVKSTLAIAQHLIEESLLFTDPVTIVNPPPPVPLRVVGSKRKFVGDQRGWYDSINPARKLLKLPYVIYFAVMYLKR